MEGDLKGNGNLGGKRVNWTTDKPTKPGWYWYKSQRDRMQIVDLIEWNNGLRVIGIAEGMYSQLVTHRFPYGPDAEWAGPLDSPT